MSEKDSQAIFLERLRKLVEKANSNKGTINIEEISFAFDDMNKVYAATIDRGIHLGLSAPKIPDTKGHDARNLVWLP